MKKIIRSLVASLFALQLVCAPLALAQNQNARNPNETATLKPADNLVVEGIPEVPLDLVARVGRYTEFRAAGFASWHPTKREMLISTRFGDTAQAHLVRMPMGARTQMTFFPETVSGANFEPTKGDYFVFGKDIGGNEFFQLYRYDMQSGDVQMLTDGKSRNTGGAWSHDGTRIAYQSTRRNGADNDIYLMNPRDQKSDRLLLQVAGGGWGVSDWSPDDKRLLVGQYISISESNLYIADAQTGEKTQLTPVQGAEKIAYGDALFSRDGRGIYLTTDKDAEFQRLAYMDLGTKQFEFLTDKIKWDVDTFALSEDGKMIAFVTNEDGISRLHLMDTKSRKEMRVPELPVGIINGIEWHKNNRDLGFSMTNARSTSDVYSIDVTSGKLERWTQSETGGLNTANFSEPELVRWKSFDGREISGFLYRPDQRKFPGKRPVVVNIHGGPEGQARPGFQGRNNYFINELGVAIIFPNVRGSSGYGKTFSQMDNGMKREDTYKDINALFDWIAAQKDLDANRVMVTGGSYGGHMTLAIATYYPERVAASLAVVGISNFNTFLNNTESYRRDLRRVEYGDERDPKMREFFERTAPLNNAKKITKPLFVVQGRNDPRVPVTEALQMVKTVRANSTPVWYLEAKDEGHGFAKKKNQDFQFYSTMLFMQQYLLK